MKNIRNAYVELVSVLKLKELTWKGYVCSWDDKGMFTHGKYVFENVYACMHGFWLGSKIRSVL